MAETASVTVERGGSPAALVRYVLAATLARSADAGAGLGLVLLALTPRADLDDATAVGGLLVAALSAPHVAGPLVARRLDAAADGRHVLATAFLGYGVALAAAAVLLGRTPLWVVTACVVTAGLCGPLLTGGLSSRLTDIAASSPTGGGRAGGWDAVTYGIAGTAGPALVAALAGLTNPLAALLALAGAAVVAAAVTLTLPRAAPSGTAMSSALTVRAALSLIVRTGPLRRVTYATMLAAVTGGALAILAVALGRSLSDWPTAGAALAAVFGAGNLLGSLAVTAHPLHGDPDRLTTRYAALVAAAFAACGLAPTYPLALVAFAVAGIVNAPFFTATLAARARYAPAQARAQVFVSVAGLKIAAASGGTALAGSLLSLGPRVLLLGGALLTAAAALTTVLDRRATPAGPLR